MNNLLGMSFLDRLESWACRRQLMLHGYPDVAGRNKRRRALNNAGASRRVLALGGIPSRAFIA
jgi:hypothetical protein